LRIQRHQSKRSEADPVDEIFRISREIEGTAEAVQLKLSQSQALTAQRRIEQVLNEELGQFLSMLAVAADRFYDAHSRLVGDSGFEHRMIGLPVEIPSHDTTPQLGTPFPVHRDLNKRGRLIVIDPRAITDFNHHLAAEEIVADGLLKLLDRGTSPSDVALLLGRKTRPMSTLTPVVCVSHFLSPIKLGGRVEQNPQSPLVTTFQAIQDGFMGCDRIERPLARFVRQRHNTFTIIQYGLHDLRADRIERRLDRHQAALYWSRPVNIGWKVNGARCEILPQRGWRDATEEIGQSKQACLLQIKS